MRKNTKLNVVHRRKGVSGSVPNVLLNANNNNVNVIQTGTKDSKGFGKRTEEIHKMNDTHARKRSKNLKMNKQQMKTSLKPVSGGVEDGGESGRVFPQQSQIIVFFITLCARLYYVSRKRNWWILHPDEVFQIPEVAHSEVYGYGFRPYEYLPPPQGTFSSKSAAEEARLGMYGLRSFILPKLFMFVMTMAECVGIQDQPFMVSKFFHAAVSSTLPLSIYKLAISLFNCHDVAVLAAVMGGASLHLTMFGTHVLVNSFLSPVVFWGLASVMDTITHQHSDCHKTELRDSTSANVINNTVNNGDSRHATNNNNNNTNISANDIQNGCCSVNDMDHIDIQRIANTRIFLTGSILGICSYIRVDLVLFLAVFFIPFTILNLRKSWNFFITLVKFAFSVVAGMAIAGVDDLLSYNQWGLSVYQWMKFNVISGSSATFFGESVGTKYLHDILLCNWLCASLTMVTLTALAAQSISLSVREHFGDFTISLSITCVVVVLFVVYSLQPHKETRFVHNIVVLLCILQAKLITGIMAYTDTRLRFSWAIWTFTFLYLISTWALFPNTEDNSHTRWTFHQDQGSSDVNQCLDYVSQQNDVTGLFNGYTMQGSGGYSALHKNITLLTLVHREFCEYSSSARTTAWSVNPFKLKPYTISIVLANKVSDYIASENLAYVYKVLVEDPIYNYAIVPRNSDFKKLGYLEVFHTRLAQVVRRSTSPKLIAAAKEFVRTLRVWENATVLEHEGSWLLSLGVPQKAIPRLERALSLTKDRIPVYQLLMKAYDGTGNAAAVVRAQQECYRHHGSEVCLRPQKPVELYSIYVNRP